MRFSVFNSILHCPEILAVICAGIFCIFHDLVDIVDLIVYALICLFKYEIDDPVMLVAEIVHDKRLIIRKLFRYEVIHIFFCPISELFFALRIVGFQHLSQFTERCFDGKQLFAFREIFRLYILFRLLISVAEIFAFANQCKTVKILLKTVFPGRIGIADNHIVRIQSFQIHDLIFSSLIAVQIAFLQSAFGFRIDLFLFRSEDFRVIVTEQLHECFFNLRK